MNASCAADLIRSPGPGKGTHFHPLATRVNERFDPTPPSPASDIGPILPKVPSHPAPHETAETAGSPPANHPVPSASPPPPLQPLASGHALSRPALRHPSRSAPTCPPGLPPSSAPNPRKARPEERRGGKRWVS